MTVLRRRLTGLLALVLIIGILAGLPAALMAVGANPLPAGVPTLEAIKHALMSPDDGTLAIGLIKIVGWCSWAFLTLSILLEGIARVRGVQAPRLPGMRLPQNAARGLLGTAMLLFIAVPNGVAHAATSAAGAPVGHAVVSVIPASSPAQASPVATRPPQQNARPPTVKHTVTRGETLWSIAAEHLGDGHRYREIVDLNEATLGGRPGFLRVGWILDIPTHPVAADSTVVVEKGDTLSAIALEHYGDTRGVQQILEASRGITQPGGAYLSDPDVIDVGWTLKVSGAVPTQPPADPPGSPAQAMTPQPGSGAVQPVAPPAAPPVAAAPSPGASAAAPTASPSPSPAPQQQPAATAVDEHLQEDSAWMARTGYGVGSLLAAGVITLLARRRGTQQRRRRPGQRLPLPSGRPAEAEQELRATADTLSTETVDVALRCLAHACTETGTSLPAVRAARLTATQLDLYLAEPAELPNPWTGTADTTVWTLDVDHTADLLGADLADVPAPYPALVTVGHDEDEGHVLLNLEHLGSLGVSGDDTATREILAALAIELASSTWADDLQVTVVGVFPDLEDALHTGRIRYLPSAGRILDDLLNRADRDRRALAAAGVPDLHHARVTGATPDSWVPEIVLFGGEITPRQRNQLEQLLTGRPRVAVATVTAGVNVGEWGLDLTAGDDPDHAVLAPIGLALRPQRLPAEQYGHLLQITSLADVEELDVDATFPEPSLADVEFIPVVDEPAAPVSAIPQVTLEHLTAADTRADDAAGELASTRAADVDDVSASAARRRLPGTDPNTLVLNDQHTTHNDAEADDSTGAPEAVDRESADEPTIVESDNDQELPAEPTPFAAPRVVVLGPVDLLHAGGTVEPTKRARLLEYAAYLALTPGATHTAIDDAIWPDRGPGDNVNTRNTATSKLRRWVGTDPNGEEYLPRFHTGQGYAFLPTVTTDADDWQHLIGGNPFSATTENLEAALGLVRGVPFEGTHRKRYAWAEPIKQRLIEAIVDASYELTRRRLMEGRWRAAEAAVVVGLRLDPAKESLWRLRILAAHESRNPAAETEAVDRLLTITEELECELEAETEQLLVALKNPGSGFDSLMANAL